MAGFQTHITVSTAVGAGLAWVGHDHYGLGWSTCAVAGTLCSIGGMMPDLDSDSGVPARETISFAAAVVPMVLFTRMRHQFGMDVEHMLLVGAPIYLFIRFVLGSFLKSITVHRGMFHSLPAVAIAGMLAYLICDAGVSTVRVFKATGFAIGYLSHLVLDEIWSVEVRGLSTRVKSSFGTALKFFGQNATANSSCYAILILLGLAVMEDRTLSVPNRVVAPPVPQWQTPPPGQRGVIAPPENRPMFQARTHRFDVDDQ